MFSRKFAAYLQKLEHIRWPGSLNTEAYLETPAVSKTEFFVTLVNRFQQLTNVITNFILDVAVVLDPSLKLL